MSDSISPRAARIYGAAAIGAPFLLLASTVAYVTVGEGINHGALGGTIGVWSCFVMVIALIGILRMLEPRAPRAAPIVAVLAVAGWSGGVAFNVAAIFEAAFVDAMEVVWDAEPFTFFAWLPWGWFAPLSLLLTGIFLYRTRLFPRWSSVLLMIGGLLFPIGRAERLDLVALATDGVLIAALVPIGVALLASARPERAADLDSAARLPRP